MFIRNIVLFTIVNSYLLCQSLFFSEYAEGSSNNKYLEIYNPTSEVIDLTNYAYPSVANDPATPGEYEYWNDFEEAAIINPGDVYVICHGGSDPLIIDECDENHTYLSNGNDGYCLVSGTDSNYSTIDCIGDWNADPGDGWDVAGVSEGTKDHTLVRKIDVVTGNSGNWSYSAGTNSSDSEWVVLEMDEWSYLGFHPHDIEGGISDDGGTTGGGDDEDCTNGLDDDGDGFIDCDDFDCPPCDGGEICDNDIDDDGDGFIDCDDFDCPPCEGGEICDNEIDDDGDGFIDCDDFDCPPCDGGEICDNDIDDDGDGFIDCDDFDCPPCDGGEICDNDIDDDGDSYIDCNDFDCSNDSACNDGTTGSCAEYGCVGYTPANACQCNDQCNDFGNCCDDYEEICTGEDAGGTTGGGDGGGTDPVDADLIFFSEYAEGTSNNKYLEIYNADNNIVDLGLYSISTCANGCNDGVSWDYPSNIEFSSGTNLNPGDVYIVCNGSADGAILAECDQFFTYLSNGDDVMGLTQLSTGGTLDIIGIIGDDPGDGWDVAGVNNATKDHTLVRKPSVSIGNNDWSSSAGTNTDNSEWIVFDQNTWDNLGIHESGPVSGCMDNTAYNYNPDALIDDQSSCIYISEVTIQEIQGQSDLSPYENLPVSSSGIITAMNSNGFYMQHGTGPWSGIWVYNNGLDLLIEVGQEVRVMGYVVEFYGLTEIEADSVETINENVTVVDPVEVSTNNLNNESYESVFVIVTDALCTALPNQYDDWVVNDSSGDLLVGDDFISYSPNLDLLYNIVGIMDYEFSEFKIQAIDIEVAYEDGAPVAVAGDDQFVDEGVVVTLDGSGSFDDNGQIIGYEWVQTDGIAVDLGNYENDIVQFTAPNQFTALEFSLVAMDNEFNFSYPDYIRITVGSQGIYDIQYTENVGSSDEDCYPSDFIAQTVNISGIVTAVKSFSTYPNFFIQDPNLDEWSGVYVYVGEAEPFNIGDEVNFSAEVEEYFGVTELKNIEDAQILSQNNEINSVSISTGDLGLTCGVGEKYEGMLIDFSNVVVESIDAEYNSVYVNDGSGTAKIDDYFFNFDAGFWPDLNIGDNIENVIGVVHYYFGEYVIYPRDLTDLGGNGSTSEICNDGLDNDGDSYIDCDDYDCDEDASCGGTNSDEICNDGLDNDGDSYIDCDDYDCDDDTSCDGSGSDGGNTDCDDSVLANLFFSEYAEGSSNNKYLEIYNNSNDTINLCGYAFPNSTNGADVNDTYDYWNTFDDGASVASGDVYIICHPSSDDEILADCDQTHTYLSNGDDGFCLAYGNENNFEIFDCIGTWSEADPGDGWDVAGITNATKDHTLVRKSSVSSGNSDWSSSAGTDSDDSEWIVLEQNDWTYLGFHDSDNEGSDTGGGCVATGDINNDNNINVVDVVQVVNYVLGAIDFNGEQSCAADLNSDGIINVIDVVQLVNIILGIN